MYHLQDNIWEKMLKEGSIAGHPVQYFQEINSTNELARRKGTAGIEKGTIIIADCQKRGRGRHARPWLSPPGSGLYFSLILSPDLAPADLPKITLTTGVALCRAIGTYLVNPVLKWPNDLLLGDKKIAGILTETCPLRGSNPLVILGIGINVNNPPQGFPADLTGKVSTIEAAYGRALARGKLLEIILKHIDDLLIQAEDRGFADILGEWRSYDACKGRYLTWLTTSGRVIYGISRGIDDEGRLTIKDDQGRIHEVISGDITLGRENN